MVKRSKMSGSEDSSENMGRCGKSKKKIVMRIEFDDSDGSTSEEDSVRPSCSSTRSKNRGNKKRVISSDDSDSSTDSEVIRTVIVRGRTGSKAVIHEDDMDEVHQNNSSNSGNAIPSNSFDNSTSSVLKDDGFSSDSSTDNGLEKCPICLLSFRNQEIGSPNTCDHLFCALCIEEWSKNVTTCPIDRKEFKSITVRQSFENKTVVREVNIEKTGAPIAEEDEEDLTRCEVCHQADREDVMLLCDGCNNGFHMDCLTPPLAQVPEGYWYCDNCFESESEASEDNFELLYEDLQEIGVPSTRLRIREVQQPRITRTRQSERIRASIVARTRPTRSTRHIVRENVNEPRASSSRQTQSVAPSTSRTTKSKRRRATGRRRARRGRRYKTYVVEYDLNASEKFPIRTAKKVIKRRRRRRTRRSTRNQPSNSSVQCQQVSLGRAEIGVSFSLFGSANALDYFSDESDVTDSLEMGRGEAGVAMAARSRMTRQSTSARIRQKGVVRDLDRPTPAPQPDVLSNILEMQSFWHNSSTSTALGEVKINPDGTLNIPKRSEESKSPIKSKEEKKVEPPKPEKVDTTPSSSGTQNEVTQAPMYPRGGSGGGGGGGGGGNYSFGSRGTGGNYNNRFNNQSSGYRGSNNSSFSNTTNFRNSTGGLGSSGFNNAFQRDNNNFQGTTLPSGHFTNPDFRNRFRNQNNNNNNNNQNNRRNFIQFPNFMASTPNITLNTGNSLNSSLNSALSNLSSSLNNSSNMSNFNDRCQNISNQPPMREIGPQLPSPSEMSDKDDDENSPNDSGDDERTNDTLDIPLPLYSPTSSFNETEKHEKDKQNEKKADDQTSKIVPPLQPPPWNNNLFRLAASYDDQDDDDDDCPNFSVYSAESFQVARSREDAKPENADDIPQEDDCEEKEEDLVQLGDDDEIPIPDAIESEKKVDKTENGSEIYDPEDPNTDVYSEKDMEESENDEPFDEESLDKESLDNASKDGNEDSEKPPESSAEVAEPQEMEEKENADDSEDAVQEKKVVDPDDSNINTSKKGVLELYDDSDWEEWNIEKTEVMKTTKSSDDKSGEEETEKHDDNSEDERSPRPAVLQAEAVREPVVGADAEDEEEEGELSKEEEKVDGKTKDTTESISEEEERSYTPCLDEKIDHNETIKEKEDETKDKDEKSDGETPANKSHKDDDSDRAGTPPGRILGMDTEMISDEDEEILNQEHNRGSAERKKDTQDRKGRKGQFKKISKSTKGRNYRDKDGVKRRGRSPSRSHNRENHRQDRSGRRRMRRKDIERYDVRNIIGQPRTYKDRYGRDTSRPARSLSRSRSRVRSKSRSRSRSRRHRSRSKSKSRSIRRSFSMSPTPASFGRYTPRRTTRSPRRSKSIRRSRSFRRSPVGKRRGKSPVRGRSIGRRRSPMRSRSPIRGRTPQRLRSPIRARTPNRLRSRSLSRSYSKSISRSRSRSYNGSLSGTPRPGPKRLYRKRRSQSSSRSGSRSPVAKKKRSRSLRKASREKRKERKKKKSKKHASPGIPMKRTQRRVSHNGEVTRKKKRRSRTRSPIVDRFSETPPLNTGMNADPSWTPPLVQSNAENLRVILSNKELLAKRRKEKKKKAEKRREKNSNKERRKQRSALRDSPVAPSKEVFASGDNILVSVSFNKENTQPQQTTVVTLPPTREEIISRRTPERVYRKSKKKDKSQRRHKKTDAKPVAIIDLDRSPFQVIAQSPKDVIILTDSEREAEEEESNDMNKRKNNVEIQTLERTPIDMRMESIEKNISVERSEKATEAAFDMPQLGPKTPPEPPIVKFSLPSKNKQIKNRNPLHEQEEIEDEMPEKNDEQDIQNGNKIGPNTPPESGPCSPDAYDPFDPTKSPSASPSTPPPAEMPQTIPDTDTDMNADKRDTRQIGPDKNINPVELVMALMTSKQALSQDVCKINSEPAYITTNNDLNDDKAEENNMTTKSITVLSNVLIAPGKHGNIPPIASPQNVMSKLPMPKQSNNRVNGGASNEEIFEDLESPYSPGSADYEDLFEPPPETNRLRSSKGNKPDIFDHLFGSSPTTRNQAKKRSSKQQQHRKFSVRVAKVPGSGMDPDQIKIFDDLPSSAVELQVKDKYVRKLHRQERVVEEVKLVLKPYYTKKVISKEVYKEILRRSVPKICHSRSGEINPKKIQNLVEAYVKKFRQKLKLSLLSGTAQVSSASKCAAYLKKL